MDYKILYLEDQKADSMVDDFKNEGVELVVDKAESVDVATETMRKETFDAYLMDYRLSQGKSFFDAPPFAAYLRTEDKKGKMTQRPIFLITSEKGLHIVKEDMNDQDLFDLVLLKDDYNNQKKKTIELFISYIKAYQEIEEKNYKMEEVLQISKEEVKFFIDLRLMKELESARREKNTYRFLRKIAEHLIKVPGVLVDEQYLASRLGVDIQKSGIEWNKLTVELSDRIYSGVLSESFDRWWMPRVLQWWETIGEGNALRRLDAKERVDVLNRKLNLKLEPAVPLKFCESSNFWSVCRAMHKPIDPAEGYVCNSFPKRPWEENEYVSAVGALEYTQYQKYLNVLDKKEVLEYGKSR